MIGSRRGTATASAVAVIVLAAAGAPARALAAPPPAFSIGFADGISEYGPSGSVWIDRAVAAGARFVLLAVDWANVAPSPPPRGSDPSDPANPAYHWGTLDQTVQGAVAHGLTVAFTIAGGGGGPSWADGPNRPSGVQPGTWEPSATAFGEFARAVARRYSGSFNPGGGVLPRVRYYQGWGEPNLPNHLNPQWVRVNGQWTAASPAVYRKLLNAFYEGVKSVHGSNMVITAGTAPYGDAPGGQRVPPALFVRELLCVNGPGLTRQRCPDPAHFDILAHNPYEIAGPYVRAANPDDVTLPDFSKLTKPLHAAERDGLALPRGRKALWATEFSWDSNPPDPQGVPVMTRAYWIEEAFYELWSEGVSAMAWYLIGDQPPKPSYATTYQSGIYYRSGRVKPGLEGFRFPFVVAPGTHGRSRLWGVSPRAGVVLVQRQRAGGWATLYHLQVAAHGIFTRMLTLGRGVHLRARIGGESSLIWPRP